MRQGIRKISHIFTVDGSRTVGWETDLAPQRQRDANPGRLKLPLLPNRAPRKEPPELRSRLLHKNGVYNFVGKNIRRRKLLYIYDFWNTLIDFQWYQVGLIFFATLISSWLAFGVVFYFVAKMNGDLATDVPADFEHCFVGFNSFASAFLYSIETMHTIGYGSRYPTDNCPAVAVVICFSALFGTIMEAFIVGIVFAKFQMPAHRAQTVMFSTNAAISVRDGDPCLLFRVGNLRKGLIIQLVVRAHLVQHKLTEEEELLPFHQHELQMTLDSMSGSAFSLWPVTACHKIGADSPLYDISQRTLANKKFEIVVTLEGVVENTGSVVQARTSYIPSEIKWGYSFPRLLTFRKEKGEYVVDYDNFQTLEPVDNMPWNSAHELVAQRHVSPDLTTAATGQLTNLHQPDVTIDQHVREMFKPPSPSLARAVSSLSPGSIMHMEKNFEKNVRKFSRVNNPMLQVDHHELLFGNLREMHSRRVSRIQDEPVKEALETLEEVLASSSDESEVTVSDATTPL